MRQNHATWWALFQDKSARTHTRIKTLVFGKKNNKAQSTDEHRESAFLFQRLSVLIQRYNAVAVLGTFTHTTPEDEM